MNRQRRGTCLSSRASNGCNFRRKTRRWRYQIIGAPTEAPLGDDVGGMRSQVFCTFTGS
jgi:hypothetical protein